MKKKELNTEIIETIQEIGALFHLKGIRAVPFSINYSFPNIPEGMERFVILELLIYLEELCSSYYKKYKKNHKFKQYISRFYEILDLNTNENKLISTTR